MSDFGVRVSSAFVDGPLWRLTSRQLRLWMYLAMMGQHPPKIVPLSDGQRVTVSTGQWLTSARKLRKELGVGSLCSIVDDLAALKRVGVIDAQPVMRYRSRNAPVPDSVTPPLQKPISQCVMATLVTVAGVPVAAHPVTGSVTKKEIQRKPATSSPFSGNERDEQSRALELLAAEGR